MPVFNPDPVSSLPQNDDLQSNDLQPAPIDLDKPDEPALSAPVDAPLWPKHPPLRPSRWNFPPSIRHLPPLRLKEPAYSTTSKG